MYLFKWFRMELAEWRNLWVNSFKFRIKYFQSLHSFTHTYTFAHLRAPNSHLKLCEYAFFLHTGLHLIKNGIFSIPQIVCCTIRSDSIYWGTKLWVISSEPSFKCPSINVGISKSIEMKLAVISDDFSVLSDFQLKIHLFQLCINGMKKRNIEKGRNSSMFFSRAVWRKQNIERQLE